MTGILVLVETDADGVTLVSREALTFARRLADGVAGPESAQVDAVVVGPAGDDISAVRDQLGEHGVSVVHHGQDDRLASFAPAAWAAAVVDAATAASASVVSAAGTPRGNEILAHVATRQGAVMAANVVAVEETKPLRVSRQVLGGAALEEMRLDSPVAVMSLAGHALDPEVASARTDPEVRRYSPRLTEDDLRARVARIEAAAEADTAALTDARVVVGAGRGAGGPDGFTDLLELVDLLDGALGVSRVVTSLGWRPHHEQVGQTGSRISPDLYVAAGISGAIQHWAGCQSAKTILAINTDEDAPMVTRANYAVVGDLHEVVPAINAELRRRLG
ncbi:MAG: electron transfer flavoprotein subunit alpha/FixB family protein [Nocardioidaceae bacterium]